MKKQIILASIAFALILLGYANYTFDTEETASQDIAVRNDVNDATLGDVELVNSNVVNEENYIQDIVSNDNLEIGNTDNYFEETRIQRDRMYSETIETYQQLIDSTQTPQDQKAIAVQEISNITNMKNGIMIAENLIKNKGFENVVILENNGSVSVIVKASNLSQDQISKIQNIVERELKIELSKINISNK